MKMSFSLVWGQCSDSVNAKMVAQTNFTTIFTTSDSLALLKLLKQDAFKLQSLNYEVQAKYKAKWRFFHLLKIETLTTSPFLTVSTTFYWKGRPLLSKLQPKIR